MAGPSRYDVSDREAGVENGILINKIGISSQKDLDDAETLLLNDAYTNFHERLSRGGVALDVPLLFSVHAYFLGPLYSWAGKLRTVDISKDGMLFAPVAHLHASMKAFSTTLRNNLPVKTDSRKRIAEKLAIIHNEFNAVHPFREGNGRTIRLFLDLLVASLGLPAVDWNTRDYMRACRKGMSQDHADMTRIIYRSIAKRP